MPRKPKPPAKPDPQDLLPEPMRKTWAVVPQAVLYQFVIVGALLGAGAAASVSGLLAGPWWLTLGIPAALVVGQLQNMLIPWTRSAERAMGETLSPS